MTSRKARKPAAAAAAKRSKKGDVFQLRIAPDELERFRAEAERHDMALADWIRRACRAALPATD